VHLRGPRYTVQATAALAAALTLCLFTIEQLCRQSRTTLRMMIDAESSTPRCKLRSGFNCYKPPVRTVTILRVIVD
jgi:hypothetical protein